MIVVIIIIGIVAYFLVKGAKTGLYKRSAINTFYYMSSSNNKEEHRRVCQFFHDKYKDGNHMIKIEISDANTMQFNLLSEPTQIGNTIMFELSTLDNQTKGIELMMLPDTAYIKFPDGSMINFRG